MKIALPKSPEAQQRDRLRHFRLGAAAIASGLTEACLRGRSEGMPNIALPLTQADGMRQTAQALCALSVQIDAYERGAKSLPIRILLLELALELAGFALLAVAGGWQLALGFFLVSAASRLRGARLQQ